MKLSPRKARSDQFEILNSDNKSTQDYWLLLHEDHITITEQSEGEQAKNEIQIDKYQFNRIIDWYNRKQQIRT